MTLRAKLILSYLVVACLVLVAGASSLYMLGRVNDAFRHVVEVSAPMHHAAHGIRHESLRAMLETSSLINRSLYERRSPESMAAAQEEIEEFEEAVEAATRHLDAYEALTTDDAEWAYVREVRSLLEELAAQQRAMVARAMAGAGGSGSMELWSEIEEMEHVLLEISGKMVVKELDEVEEGGARAGAAADRMIALTAGAMLVVFVLSATIGVLVSRTITRPLGQLADATVAFGRGGFDSSVPVETQDEIGQLADAFNRMAANIRREMAERIDAEYALRTAQDELLQKERLAALGTLIASVSHEIRNPLGTIRMAFESISRRIEADDPSLRKVFGRAERNIERCNTIIGELLDYTRDPELELTPTAVDPWLEQVLGELRIDPRVSVRLSLATDAEIALDRIRFQGCIVNVVDNACQAMLEGSPPGDRHELSVASAVRHGDLVVTVTDTGPGMSDEHLAQALEPMFSTRPFGVGLGLPIVEKSMEWHGGGIALSSIQGVGTTVELWMPVDPAARSVSPAHESGPPRVEPLA